MVLDFHTHCLQAEQAIINADACQFFPEAGKCYSVGVHPWLAEDDAAAQWERVQALAAHPQVVAIGETGLDSLRGAPLAASMPWKPSANTAPSRAFGSPSNAFAVAIPGAAAATTPCLEKKAYPHPLPEGKGAP